MLYALHTLNAPGSLVAGYRTGDPISEAVAESWGLILGEDVSEDAPDTEAAPALTRPTEEDNRATWEAWAVANGMTPEDADQASQEDLEATGPSEAPAPAEHPRPADSAKKGDWVLYVNDHPQATAEDQVWAGDDTTTKADLQAWQPKPADPVAVAATEQANG